MLDLRFAIYSYIWVSDGRCHYVTPMCDTSPVELILLLFRNHQHFALVFVGEQIKTTLLPFDWLDDKKCCS
jgi:hypothetical protein